MVFFFEFFDGLLDGNVLFLVVEFGVRFCFVIGEVLFVFVVV